MPDNVTGPILPPYSPELNPMEKDWAYLRSNKLALRVFETYEEIVDNCREAWIFLAEDRKRLTSITTRKWAKAVKVQSR